jgi:hypothetical protein
MFFGKFRQIALMRKLLNDPDKLARFIRALGHKQIAAIGKRLVRKGDSYRNNLEDVMAINFYASTSSKFLSGLFSALGLLSGLFIHRYSFWANLAILALAGSLKIPKVMAEWAFKEIRLVIAIMYRFRQEEPTEYLMMLVEIPSYGPLDEAISRAENTPANAESGKGIHISTAKKEGLPASEINNVSAE